MPIENYTDEDIAGILADLQTIRDADTAEESARLVAEASLSDRIDAIFIPTPGELDPNVLQAITALQLAVQQEVIDRGSSQDTLQSSIENFVTGADPALVDTHTTKLTELDDRLTLSEASIINNATAISDEASARAIQFTDEITPQWINANNLITALDATLTQEVVDRSIADISTAEQIDVVNASISGLASSISDEESARINSDSSFSDQIAALGSSLALAQQKILLHSGIGVDPLGALSSRLLDLTYQANDLDARLTSHASDFVSDILDVQTDISTLQGLVTTATDNLTDEIADRTSADNNLQVQITALDTALTTNGAALTAEATTRANADSVLTSSLATNDATLATQVSGLADEVSTREALSIAFDDQAIIVGGFNDAIAGLQTDVNLIKTEYLLILDSDLGVAGYQRSDSSDPSTDFLLTAERIALQTGGGTPVHPFSIEDGELFITDASLSGSMSGILYADSLSFANMDFPVNTMPASINLAKQLPSNFSMSYGAGTDNTFLGNDLITRVVPALVYTDSSLVMHGANYGAGFDEVRLSKTTDMTFNVIAGGSTNSVITVWYRVKDDPMDGGTWNYAGTFEHGIPSGARDYERADSAFQFTAAVGETQVIEFGMNALNGQGLPVNPAFDSIYSGYMKVNVSNIS